MQILHTMEPCIGPAMRNSPGRLCGLSHPPGANGGGIARRGVGAPLSLFCRYSVVKVLCMMPWKRKEPRIVFLGSSWCPAVSPYYFPSPRGAPISRFAWASLSRCHTNVAMVLASYNSTVALALIVVSPTSVVGSVSVLLCIPRDDSC